MMKLSKLETDIISLIIKEKTDYEIADILNYSLAQIKKTLRIIFQKYDVKGRVGLVREVIKEELCR